VVTLSGGITAAANSVSVTGTVNFNGGTLKAGADSADFASGGSLVVQSGGATIDTGGHAVTLQQTLTHASGPALDGGLTALLGPDSVGTLCLHNRWAPEERSRIVPAGTKHAQRSSFVSSATEPVRWLPEPLACRTVSAEAPLVRFAQAEWWRGVRSTEHVMLWIEGALAIVEIEGAGARIRGFVD
jgi:hypothetical protein